MAFTMHNTTNSFLLLSKSNTAMNATKVLLIEARLTYEKANAVGLAARNSFEGGYSITVYQVQ